MTLVSIIIPAYNSALWIRETLQSVVDQGFQEVEVIVIDDGSVDNTADIVVTEFPFATLVRTENGGPSRARNIGTAISSGEFIQYLDSDDVLAPQKLKSQISRLAASGADVAYGDWQRLVACHSGIYQCRDVIERRIADPEIDLFTDFWCPPAVYLFRRSIVQKTSGWNESLPIIQDARFVLDCALQGGTFVYTPGIMAYYRVHSSGSVSTRNTTEFIRDCLRNAQAVQDFWLAHGGVTPKRRQALLHAFSFVARGSYESDHVSFNAAYIALEGLMPHYIPAAPRHLALVSRIMGYRRAEQLALEYRRLKRRMKREHKNDR